MSAVWFKPTKSAAYCHYRLDAAITSPVQTVVSTCGIWRSKIAAKDSIPASEKGLAPDCEICERCAAHLKIQPKPTQIFTPHFSLLSEIDRVPIEEMKHDKSTDEDPPDELAGVDLTEL